ncbi:MAG TPA: DNA methyltransferase, partial [Actinomycetes bacterium]|nr:DNA methyltransferase [Actinomycetes bacterium]
ARTPAGKNPMAVFNAFLARLRAVRVLDPACGSGNFLYVALQALKDLKREAILWASLALRMPMQLPEVGPEAVLGIEINSYAAELARVVIWIGQIQWMLTNGFAYERDPILRSLDNIECRDAVLDLSDPEAPAEPSWPAADVIIGNPPFVGNKLLRGSLGDDYLEALFRVYRDRVPGEADLVVYWHEKARAMLDDGRSSGWDCWPPRASAVAPTGGSWSGSSRPATSSWPGRMRNGWSRGRPSTSRSSATTMAPRPSARSTASWWLLSTPT